MSARIEPYAMIGDCETAALVSHRSSIEKTAAGRLRLKIRYQASGGIWITLSSSKLFSKPDGLVSLVDFMPVRRPNSRLVRTVRGLSGSAPMEMKLALRFDYGRTIPWVTRIEHGALRAIAGPDMVVLHSPEEHHGDNLQAFSEFTIKKG